eukprot:3139196-Alexandrium_andersonii.AAC.1
MHREASRLASLRATLRGSTRTQIEGPQFDSIPQPGSTHRAYKADAVVVRAAFAGSAPSPGNDRFTAGFSTWESSRESRSMAAATGPPASWVQSTDQGLVWLGQYG